MGKLIKHELRAAWRIGFPLTLAALFVSVMGGLVVGVTNLYLPYSMMFVMESPPFLHFAAIFIAFMCFIALCLFPSVALFWLTARYYKSMFTDEGYLTNVLPYKTETLYYAKFLSALIVSAAAYVVMVVGMAISIAILAVCGVFPSDFSLYVGYIIEIFRTVGFEIEWSGIVMVLFSYLVSWVAQIALTYFVVTTVSLFAKKGRLVLGVCMYLGITSVGGVITEMLLLATSSVFLMSTPGTMVSSYNAMFVAQNLILLVYYVPLCLVSFFVSRHLLRKKLNIE